MSDTTVRIFALKPLTSSAVPLVKVPVSTVPITTVPRPVTLTRDEIGNKKGAS